MNRKGFTLIELLAVIVILVIIALITTIVILNNINGASSAREKVKQRSAELVYMGVKYAYVSAMYGGTEGIYVVNPSLKDIKQYLNIDNVDKENKVKFDNDDTPTMLKIETNDGAYCEVTIEKGLQVACYSSIKKENAKHYFTKYGLSDSEVVGVTPVSFATDSWDTIQKAVQSGNYPYKVGDTKTVILSDLGTFTLRVANTSTPDVCNSPSFSQTACGFVVEFQDIITKSVINIGNISTPNTGGWKESDIRKYVNDTIYKALPTDLQNIIIDTFVVSGHSYMEEYNFETTDKLYLLATGEIWIWANGTNNENIIGYDTARDRTRQLDYYAQKGVTTDNYSAIIKKYNGEADSCWLRSALSYNTGSFFLLGNDGRFSHSFSIATYGVSPAFRIG